jgi:hypothetical protein
MSRGTRPPRLLLVALATALTGIAGSGVAPIGLSEAAFFGVGGALVLMIVGGGSPHRLDALYPARMQLARFRRSGRPVDVLVVQLPASTSSPGRRANRRCTHAVSSVLRVTDGVSMVPSLGGTGLCAVLEADARARTAIDRRVRRACGNQVQIAWASAPEDGVTLESLLGVALDRLPSTESRRAPRPSIRPLPVHRLVPGGLGSKREAMRSAR